MNRSTEADYRYAVQRVVSILGRRTLDTLTADDGDTLLYAFEQTLAPRTIRKTIRVLNDALGLAVKRKKLLSNPFRELDLPKVTPYVPVVLNADQVWSFLEAVAEHRWSLVYRLLFAYGARETEVLAMQWTNLTWRAVQLADATWLGRYDFTNDLDRETFALDALKTEHSRRSIYLPQRLVDDLRHHYLMQEAYREQSGARDWNPNQLMFPTKTGSPIRPNNFWRHFKKVSQQLGLPERTTVHHIRHTFRRYAAEKLRPDVVQGTLGHSDIRMTYNMYGAGVSERAKQHAALTLDALYEVSSGDTRVG